MLRHAIRPSAAAALALLLVLAACAETGGSGSVQGDLADVFNDARHNPDRRDDAVERCSFILLLAEDDPGFKDMISGLFDVSVAEAERAYCAAMVEASISDEFTESDLARLQVPREQRGMEPFGKMLRKVLDAHERLRAQRAQWQPQTEG